MQVFYHHIYEFQKGLRNLVLCTEKIENKAKIEKRLQRENIEYVIHQVDSDKINIYYGQKACIDVVNLFSTTELNKITEEEDYILGIMLGYDRLKQCERYLSRKNTKTSTNTLVS